MCYLDPDYTAPPPNLKGSLVAPATGNPVINHDLTRFRQTQICSSQIHQICGCAPILGHSNWAKRIIAGKQPRELYGKFALICGISHLGGGFKHFWNFHPENLGKWSNLANMFQMGWNHQLVIYWQIDQVVWVVNSIERIGCSSIFWEDSGPFSSWARTLVYDFCLCLLHPFAILLCGERSPDRVLVGHVLVRLVG